MTADADPRARPLGPVPRVGARAFLGLDRVDLAWLCALVLSALVLRVASPIFPDWLSRPFSGAPLTAWGLGTPWNASGCVDAPVDGRGKVLPATTVEVQDGRPTTVRTTPQSHCGFVFDEVYFPVDASKDLQQPPQDYFDPEPPLAKLMMAPAIDLLGFGTWSWRITCAITGSLLVGVVYLIARRLRDDRFFAVAAATFVALDGLALVESRTGVIDTVAIFLAAVAVYVFLLHWAARTRAQWRATLYAFAVAIGLAFGAKLTALAPLAVAAALIGGRLLEPMVRRALRLRVHDSGEPQLWRDAAGGRRALLHYGLAGLLALTVFTGCYARYLSVDHVIANFGDCRPDAGPSLDTGRPQDGSGIPGYTLYRAPDIGRNGNPLSDVAYFVGDIVHDVRGQVGTSIQYHDVECRGHPYASRWYTWPGLAHPVLFYVGTIADAGGGHTDSYITNLGNPAIWWLAIPALLFCLWAMTRGPTWLRLATAGSLLAGLALMATSFHAAEQAGVAAVHPGPVFVLGTVLVVAFAVVGSMMATMGRRLVPGFIVLGYLAAWMMWVFGNERRVLFLYHMLGALLFMALALAYALTALRSARISTGARTYSLAPLAWTAFGLVVAAFVYFYPIWTGLPQTDADHATRTWFLSWFYGW